MSTPIRLQIMDTFNIFIDERQMENLALHSKKGANFLALLITNEGRSVPNYKLLSTLWNDDRSSNPENSLKTLVSRLRAILNEMSPELGKCIVADRGSYHFELQPDMTVDALEIMEIYRKLGTDTLKGADRLPLYNELIKLYKGDLMQSVQQNEWALGIATNLHNKYMTAVYEMVDILKENKQFDEISTVTRAALEVEPFDDRLHMELMSALIEIGRTGEALVQYRHVIQMNYRYLGVEPSEDLQEFYRKIINAGRTLDFNLDAIRTELRESSEYRGAFVCDYSVFKEIYNLQMRNLERLGSTMFLGLIMIGDPELTDMNTLHQETIMTGIMDILHTNLRKGDTISQITPNMVAVMLPTVNYYSGNLVMERVKRLFYRRFPNTVVAFNYRVGPLGSEDKKDAQDPAQPRIEG